MSRAPWLGRPVGRHAAGSRRRRSGGAADPAVPPAPAVRPAPAVPPAPAVSPPRVPPAPAVSPAPGGVLGAPVMADTAAAQAPGFASPVTDAARAAVAASVAVLPGFVPPDAVPRVTLDALGRKCPIPIIMLAAQISAVPVGAVVAVLADDPAAFADIPAWCGLKSHECVFRAEYATGWSFGVRRRY
jgi:tRNA 2-thiouridine synthesizing protein A